MPHVHLGHETAIGSTRCHRPSRARPCGLFLARARPRPCGQQADARLVQRHTAAKAIAADVHAWHRSGSRGAATKCTAMVERHHGDLARRLRARHHRCRGPTASTARACPAAIVRVAPIARLPPQLRASRPAGARRGRQCQTALPVWICADLQVSRPDLPADQRRVFCGNTRLFRRHQLQQGPVRALPSDWAAHCARSLVDERRCRRHLAAAHVARAAGAPACAPLAAAGWA